MILHDGCRTFRSSTTGFFTFYIWLLYRPCNTKEIKRVELYLVPSPRCEIPNRAIVGSHYQPKIIVFVVCSSLPESVAAAYQVFILITY